MGMEKRSHFDSKIRPQNVPVKAFLKAIISDWKKTAVMELNLALMGLMLEFGPTTKIKFPKQNCSGITLV